MAGIGLTSPASPPAVPPRRRRRGWHSLAARRLAYQVVAVGAVVALFAYLFGNAADALRRQGIASGFDYLWTEAGFGIGEGLISFSPSDNYLRAFLVGLGNTFKVSVVAVLAATAIGFVVGLMRLSANLGVANLAGAYVELFRNTPQLLQIILWYWLITRLPGPRQALSLAPGLWLSNRGVAFAWPASHPGWTVAGLALLAAVVLSVLAWLWAGRRQRATGRRPRLGWPVAAMLIGLPVLGWLAGGMPTAIDQPVLRGFNFRGGGSFSPEFTALFLGLSLYIGAFIAEIVRSGLQSVGRGQIDAALSLGLARGQIYRLILLPQAMRVMVPPACAQYVSLVKNSSLAVAIGYPEIVNVSNTTLGQTGHVVEAIVMMSAVYLAISFVISALMNWYNRAVLIKER
ncbi:MAG: ABC transporter permease subunit [Alphaproteobacteria bacterium]|nr:ABC transporter permease subunit [Alphaproteobacteria bacterium]